MIPQVNKNFNKKILFSHLLVVSLQTRRINIINIKTYPKESAFFVAIVITQWHALNVFKQMLRRCVHKRSTDDRARVWHWTTLAQCDCMGARAITTTSWQFVAIDRKGALFAIALHKCWAQSRSFNGRCLIISKDNSVKKATFKCSTSWNSIE